MSRVNGFLTRSLITFQTTIQKIETYRSSSAIRSHAAVTVKRGRDLSTPKTNNSNAGNSALKQPREL